VSGQGGDQIFLHPLPSAVSEAQESWLRIGCVSCRDLHDSATWDCVNSSSSVYPFHLITQQEYVVFLRASGGKIACLREYFDPAHAAKALDTPILGLDSRGLAATGGITPSRIFPVHHRYGSNTPNC
jgi:hypothetical protein